MELLEIDDREPLLSDDEFGTTFDRIIINREKDVLLEEEILRINEPWYANLYATRIKSRCELLEPLIVLNGSAAYKYSYVILKGP